MSLEALLPQELELVDEQAVDDGDIAYVPQLVDQRADDRDIDARSSQLIQAVGVVEAGYDAGPDSVDGVVDWKVGVGVGRTREVEQILLTIKRFIYQKRRLLAGIVVVICSHRHTVEEWC